MKAGEEEQENGEDCSMNWHVGRLTARWETTRRDADSDLRT